MANITVKIWRDTRASCAEGSGVAAAMKTYDAKWPSDYAKADAKDVQAFTASSQLRKALGVALGKCNKAKDDAKVKATKTLIGNWTTELEAREAQLSAALKSKQDADVETLHRAKIDKEMKDIYASFGDSLATQVEQRLVSIRRAIGAGNAQEAFRDHARAVFSYKIVANAVTPKGRKEIFETSCKKLKLNPGAIKADEFDPREYKGLRPRVAAAKTLIEDVEDELDRIQTTDNTDDAAGSPEYKAKLKGLTAEYRNVQKFVREASVAALRMLAQAKQFEAVSGQVPPDKRDATQKALDVSDQRCQSLAQNLETQLAKIRNDSGAIAAKKLQAPHVIGAPDQLKYLAPILNQAFSQNFRATRTLSEAQDLLAAAKARLQGAPAEAV